MCAKQPVNAAKIRNLTWCRPVVNTADKLHQKGCGIHAVLDNWRSSGDHCYHEQHKQKYSLCVAALTSCMSCLASRDQQCLSWQQAHWKMTMIMASSAVRHNSLNTQHSMYRAVAIDQAQVSKQTVYSSVFANSQIQEEHHQLLLVSKAMAESRVQEFVPAPVIAADATRRTWDSSPGVLSVSARYGKSISLLWSLSASRYDSTRAALPLACTY